jgi:hypothetical protein
MSLKATLATLPVEMLHRIFDELDGIAIFIAVRDVCQQLRAAVDTHHRYALDCSSLSKPDFHRLLRLIRPECVTALSLSNDEMTPGQIGIFLSSVDINHFTRLRSLTLLNIDGEDLCSFLKHAERCSLTCLALESRSRYSLKEEEEKEEIVQRLSSIIAQSSLLRFELLSVDLCDLIVLFKWSVPCRVRYLRIVCQTGKPVSQIIDRSHELETLVLDDGSSILTCNLRTPEEWCYRRFRRLTSLTVSNFSLEMDQIESILSHTPSLRHLKIVTSQPRMMDLSQLEDLIDTKLPILITSSNSTHVSFMAYRRKKQRSLC